jgi:hypothetical protein
LDILNKKVKVNVGNRDWITVDASAIGKVLKKPLDTSPRGRYEKEEFVANGEEGAMDEGEKNVTSEPMSSGRSNEKSVPERDGEPKTGGKSAPKQDDDSKTGEKSPHSAAKVSNPKK